MTPVEWTTADDLARRAGISKSTILRRIESGELNAYRFGPRLIRIPEAEASAFLAKAAGGAGQIPARLAPPAHGSPDSPRPGMDRSAPAVTIPGGSS